MKSHGRVHFAAISFSVLCLAAAYVQSVSAAPAAGQKQEKVEERDLVSSFYLEERKGFLESNQYEEYLRKKPSYHKKIKDQTKQQPIVYYDYMGMDETVCRMRSNPGTVYNNRAFFSSQFYMEIPDDWYAGTNGACPLIFCHESDQDPRGQYNPAQKTYTNAFPGKDILDENAHEEVEAFILAGGINDVLEDALGHPLTDGYRLELGAPGNSQFQITKNGINVADICVWDYIGQVVVWTYNVPVKVKASEDHGRVYAFMEWPDEDFSNPEAIKKYVKSGKADRLMESVLGKGKILTGSEYSTGYHDFLRFEGEYAKRRVALYIPVTPDYNSNWLLLFETFDGTQVKENAYDMQKRMIDTFNLQPYYHEVKRGDTLSAIAKMYTDHPAYADRIAGFEDNHIPNPDRIYPGQKIEIPLDLSFEKKHY